ncbi:Ada metal-binding domain-containing protein [Streptomyces sp. NRRL S-87]|uniref:Ada metal-binding domain-containing protein n=1 Tax=Streptomyces sp. NRRL S-87 TaxID=1463920 RepID=UPI000B12DA06|nr:Ada metal-binding domain-containing protein [Streptomyces sp. NRRL S-87]
MSGGGYVLLGPDGRPYRSAVPGVLGGHRRGRLYGRLDCPSALRALARGGYVRERVFFADEASAVAAGYRPCAVCLPERYRAWKAASGSGHPVVPRAGSGRAAGRPTAPRAGHGSGPPPSPWETLRASPGPGPRVSPLLPAGESAAHGELPAPTPHTEAELAALLGLLTVPRSRISTVVVGHGRDPASAAAARAFATAWEARGGRILATVTWPESAASWLRAARRLTAEVPDAWVVAAAGVGFAQLARRLRHSTDWDPARTYAFGSLGDSRVPALAGPGVLHGLRGAAADGTTWQVRGTWVSSPGG